VNLSHSSFFRPFEFSEPPHAFQKMAAERIVRHGRAADADDGESLREGARAGEIKEGGNEFSLREVARCPEDDHQAGIGHAVEADGLGGGGCRSRLT